MSIFDPYARGSIGRRRESLPEPVAEYESSGRFRSDPYGEAHPLDVAEMLDRLGLSSGTPRDIHDGNPIVDEWDMHRRFAESFSAGHQRLRNPHDARSPLAELFAHAIAGHRKPGLLERGDISQQVDPFDKRPALVGSDLMGTLHIPVTSIAEVNAAVQEHFAPILRKESWCGICFSKRIKPAEIKFLLRGHSFWILVNPVCLRCQRKLIDSAERVNVDLFWIDHPSVSSGI